MNDNEFLLFDRLEKIKSTIKDESQFYISYSGGKDSNVLSLLHHRFSGLECEKEIKDKYKIDLRAEFPAREEVKP